MKGFESQMTEDMIWLPITKMHGLGNSQILIKDLQEELEGDLGLEYEEIARAVCHPDYGVGSDQALVILPSEDADFKMRVFNRDGSEAEMCGNGIRCVSRYLFEKDMVEKEHKIETLGGVKNLKIESGLKEVEVEVDMGEGEVLESEKSVGDFEGDHVSIGNPHFVIFTDEASVALARDVGPGLEEAPEFQPDKANVEFVNVVSEEKMDVYVWERGAGLTLACGTGACAAAYAAMKRGLVNEEVTVTLLGGDLNVQLEDDRIKMKGPSEYVLEGEVIEVPKIFSNVKRLNERGI